MNSPKVLIIILNWNGWQDTIECLESVLRNSYGNFQIVVCDNDSQDGSFDKLHAWAISKKMPIVCYSTTQAKDENYFSEKEKNHPLILIQTGANLGFAGGNNVGIRYALAKGDAKYVWLLNNDTVIAPDSLTELVNTAEAESSVGMVGSKIYYFYDPERIWFAGATIHWYRGETVHTGLNQIDGGQYEEISEEDYITGCSLLVPTNLIKEIGAMDDDFFLYFEETDWCMRARKAGYKLLINPKSILWHKVGASTKSMPPILHYYFVRNNLLFMHRHAKWFQKVAFIPFFLYRNLRLAGSSLLKHRPADWATPKAMLQAVVDFFSGRLGRQSLR